MNLSHVALFSAPDFVLCRQLLQPFFTRTAGIGQVKEAARNHIVAELKINNVKHVGINSLGCSIARCITFNFENTCLKDPF